ncbi:MAG: TonB-dependent receptor plug domain-containing protein [Pseudomonadales bacterium]
MKTQASRPWRRTALPARFFLLSALAVPSLLYGQDPSPPVDETLRVLGHRTTLGPAAQLGQTLRFDDYDLQSSGAALITDLLWELPSAAPSQAGALGSLTQLRLRGGEANHVLVRIDGFEANDPASGSEFDFSQLRSTTVSGMNLLSGAAGALWGSDALAGVLDFQTLTSTGNRTELSLEGGERGREALALRWARGSAQQGLAVTLDRFETEGTNTARTGDEDDGYALQTVQLKGHRALTDQLTVTALARQVTRRSDIDGTPAPAFIPEDSDTQGRAQQRLLGVRLDYETDQQTVSVSAEQLASRYRDAEDGARTAQRRGDRLRLVLQGTRYFPRAPLGEAVLTLAAEQEQERFDQLGEASVFGDPTQRQSLTHRSLLAVAGWRPGDRLTLSASGRFDDNEAFASAWTGRVGAEVAFTANGALWASFASAQKNPSFTERFGFTPNTFFGNANLRPERSVAAEMGVRQRWPALGLEGSVVAHRARLKDEINGFSFDGALGGFTAVNREGTSQRSGVESTLAWASDQGLEVTARYSLLDANEVQGTERRDEIRRPGRQGSLTAALLPGHLGPFSGRLTVAWREALDDTDFASFPAETVKLDALTLVRGQVSVHPNEGVTLSLLGENLLDERYEAIWGYRAPGRALYLRAHLALN